MTIYKELLDELLKGCERPEDLLGDAGLMKELKIRLMERMLGAEPGATVRADLHHWHARSARWGLVAR